MHKSNTRSLIYILSFFFSYTVSSQNQDDTPRYTSSDKGKFFFSWGGNRANFTKSDIRFTGDNYDFTLSDVRAKDRPKGYHIDYINPTRLTIPQTNAKIGYFISDKYAITLALDHMKYVANQNQFTTINGTINLSDDEVGSAFNGVYNNDVIELTEDFLRFEHTDGLNYIHTEILRYDDISSLFNIGNTDIFQLKLVEGVGGGILYPKTDSTLLGRERANQFHISGYGMSANLGLNFLFFKHFFMQLDLTGGYINLGDIRTSFNPSDRASQDFFFLQRIVKFGGIFRLSK